MGEGNNDKLIKEYFDKNGKEFCLLDTDKDEYRLDYYFKWN